MSESESKSSEAGQTAGGCGCGGKTSSGPMPKVSFTTFILSLASSGLVQLGEVPDPETGTISQNLLMAKHTIEILCMLRDKTHGCLEAEELKLLDGLLYELRMKYVLQSK